MTKKLISMLLSIAMVLSVAVVGISGVSAAIDNDGRYVPSEETATKRLYFVMPESWKNEKFGADSAGIFWWNGSDACVFNGGSSQAAPWPGYKMQVYDADANIFYIDIPELIPVIVIQLIMSFGNLMNVGFEKAYLLQTSLNKATSEIIATYVYEQGLLKAMYSFSTAVGLFNTVVNIVLLVVVNTVCKRLSDVSFI